MKRFRATPLVAPLLALLAALLAPAEAGASPARADVLAAAGAPALSCVTPARTRAREATALESSLPDEDPGFELFGNEPPLLIEPNNSERFEALAGVLLLASEDAPSLALGRSGEPASALALTGERSSAFGRSDPRTRIRVFSVLGSPLIRVSRPAGYEWRWGCEQLGLGISEGLVPSLWHDPVTGLAYARARWLDERNAVFLSEDPEDDVDSPNVYAFVGFRPNELSDPEGDSATFVGTAIGFAFGAGWAIGSSINDCLIHDNCQDSSHYLSQVAQYTIVGAELGASIDLAAVGGGSVSSTLGGAGFASLGTAASGDWSKFGKSQLVGGGTGLAFWGATKGLGAIPEVAAAGSRLAGSSVGRAIGGAAEKFAEKVGLKSLTSQLGGLAEKHSFSDPLGSVADGLSYNFVPPVTPAPASGVEAATGPRLLSLPRISNAPDPLKWIRSGGRIAWNPDGSMVLTDASGVTVPYGSTGYPNFRAAGLVLDEATLPGFTSRAKDFAAANAGRGVPQPFSTTWHHHEDRRTLQLLDRILHKRFTHRGGVSLSRVKP